MFQDEKTTELNLTPEPVAPSHHSVRWTEKKEIPAHPSASTLAYSSPEKGHSFLLRVAAVVGILLLSLWLL